LAGSDPSSDSSKSGGGLPTGRGAQHPILAVVSLAVAALAMVWLLILSDATSEHPSQAAVMPAPAGSAQPTAGPSGPKPSRDELPEPVRQYLESTVYPPDSGRLDTAADLLESNPRFERFKPVPGSYGAVPDIEFLWTADAFRYTSDETVNARFEARQGAGPVEIRELAAWAQPEGRGGAIGKPIDLSFRAEGDAWLAPLDLSRRLADHHGFVVLGVRYTVADVTQQEEKIRIFVTPAQDIPGAFTGSFRETVRNGSLEIEAGIEIYRDGFYRIDANLYGPADEPVAWAVFKGDLSRRDGVVPLRFFGKVLRDLGSGGPYRLAMLRGYQFRDGEFPDRVHLRDFTGSHVTRTFRLAEFSDAEWDGEHRRHMVELLLRDQAAGISLDLPPLAAGSGSDATPSGGLAPSAPPGGAPTDL